LLLQILVNFAMADVVTTDIVLISVVEWPSLVSVAPRCQTVAENDVSYQNAFQLIIWCLYKRILLIIQRYRDITIWGWMSTNF
jgi:hypothetical protein